METSHAGAPKEGKCVFCENVSVGDFHVYVPIRYFGKKKKDIGTSVKTEARVTRWWLNSGCDLSCQQFKVLPGKHIT